MPPNPIFERNHGRRSTDPRQENTVPPEAESDPETKSQAAQVAEFKSSKFSVSLPSAIVIALITSVSGAVVAWANKPAAVALSPEQSAKLDRCAEVIQKVSILESRMNTLEPQVGVLAVTVQTRAYTPQAQPMPAELGREMSRALRPDQSGR